MSASACEDIALWLSFSFFNRPELAPRLREMHSRHATADEYVDLMAATAPAHLMQTVRAEFDELPAFTASLIVDAWSMADAAGRRFTLRSERPDRPIAFARDGRVRVSIDAGEDGVRVTLSHVPTRHAAWYRPAALSA